MPLARFYLEDLLRRAFFHLSDISKKARSRKIRAHINEPSRERLRQSKLSFQLYEVEQLLLRNF